MKRITDLNDKERFADNIKLINIEGREFIKVLIIGNNRDWDQFYPLQEFKEKNPMMFDGLGNLVLGDR